MKWKYATQKFLTPQTINKKPSVNGDMRRQPTPAFLPGESQGRGSLVGCRLCGRTESDTTDATQQQQQQQRRHYDFHSTLDFRCFKEIFYVILHYLVFYFISNVC